VESDLRDWRTWPAKREARKQAAISIAEEALQEAIIMHDDEERRRWMGTLVALTAAADAPVRASR
jgi:hypothetical protein